MSPRLKKFFVQDFIPLMFIFSAGFFFHALITEVLRSSLFGVVLNGVLLLWSVGNVPRTVAQRDLQRDEE